MVGSLAPIARTTVMVSDGNEVNVILPNPINDVVGKTPNDPLAESASERGACFRVSENPPRRLFHRCQEPKTKPVKTGFIKLD